MRTALLLAVAVSVLALVALPVFAQTTRTGDIRTGDIRQETHVHVSPYNGRPARTSQVGLSAHFLFAPKFTARESWPEGSWDLDMDSSFGGGGAFVFKLGDIARFDLGGDFQQVKLTDSRNIKVRMVPVTAALRLGVPIANVLYLYGGGGVGWSFNTFKGTAIDLDDGLIYFACGGGEVSLSDQIALRAEFRYNWHKPDLDDGSGDDGDLQLNHSQLRGGLVFYF